ERCFAVAEPALTHSLRELLLAGQPTVDGLLRDTQFAQPALFAFEYAMSCLWESFGIRPQALVGHSVGEYVAACVAGMVSLEDGMRLITQRAALMHRLPAAGAMAAVAACEEHGGESVGAARSSVEIAALNAPRSVVISGPAEAVAQACAACVAEGIVTQPLEVSHAFHSVLMEPMLDDLTQVAPATRFGAPR